MPQMTVYRHGFTAYHPNRMGNPNPPKRGKAIGWGSGPAKRNVKWLRSVDERELSGDGWAITLTLRDIPETPAAWTTLVTTWLKRQRRKGLVRAHWVMEFTRRGRPHLHVAAWYEAPEGATDGGSAGGGCGCSAAAAPHAEPPAVRGLSARTDWVEIAAKHGAGMKGQHARPIYEYGGWAQYVAKHASRSAKHYQRQRDAMPEAWDSSPRVWGKVGKWVMVEPVDLELTREQQWRLRRLVHRRTLAEVRAGLPLNSKQFARFRRMRKCNDRKQSEVRPVSEWMSPDDQVRVRAWLSS